MLLCISFFYAFKKQYSEKAFGISACHLFYLRFYISSKLADLRSYPAVAEDGNAGDSLHTGVSLWGGRTSTLSATNAL